MVLQAARRMEEHDVGTLPVLSPAKEVVGIVTDRDITTRCVARALDPATTPVSVVMTRGVRSVNEAVPIEQALRSMAGAKTRRLVVTGDEGKLVGLIAVDDILELLAEEMDSIGRLLRKERPQIAS
jgi:CBS domain-containing protein